LAQCADAVGSKGFHGIRALASVRMDAGREWPSLLQCSKRMADWKQITARIRRARGSKNPEEQLSNLFQKTSDAMVAFELARHFEAAGQNAEAAKWYATAAQRFRRADWKTKAQEAVTRLGGQVPAAESGMEIPSDEEKPFSAPLTTMPTPGLPFEQNAETFEAIVSSPVEEAASSEIARPAGQPPTDSRPHRRRGRRGGRNRRRGGAGGVEVPAQGRSERPSLSPSLLEESAAAESGISAPLIGPDSRSMPRLPVEPEGETAGAGLKGRYGDPGLSSRLSKLEMQFRRLLTCPPAKLDRAETAPAGPGVFVLTDEEMTSYYYVESCDTLRVAIANVARGGVGRRGAPSIKPMLAEYLGIPETRVAKYLSDHCVVRWLQLDEGAAQFAHFAIAVLRPTLNE